MKREEEIINNPNINYDLMKVLRLDEEARLYLEQKYYKNTISGLMGKIFELDE